MESLQIPGGRAFQTEETVSAKALRLNYAESVPGTRLECRRQGEEWKEMKSKRWPCRGLCRDSGFHPKRVSHGRMFREGIPTSGLCFNRITLAAFM